MAGKMEISRRGINRADRIKFLKNIRKSRTEIKTFKAVMRL